jgi:ubiquinone/menaquinone biosynthesis C-methylase UbiE
MLLAMVDVEDKTLEVARDWKESTYYDKAEKEDWLKPFWSPRGPFRPLFEKINARTIVELACGHGRHTAQILEFPDYRDKIEHLYVMDVNEENIKFCEERFSKFAQVHPMVNNGYDFQPLKSESVSGVFCYDAMVHFEYDAVISYLKDAFRILVPGGRALFHHSNYDKSPGAKYTENPGWRNFMSKELFAHIAIRAGFKTLEQSLIDWDGGRKLDCISLIEKPEKPDQVAYRDDYPPIAEDHYDRAVQTMLQSMEVRPGETLLEAGCGLGASTVRVARAGIRVCAVDFSQSKLQRARARIAAAGLDSVVEFRLEDPTSLTFSDSAFSYVFSWGAINHVRDIQKALDELARIIKPGGKMALYVTNGASWDQKLEHLARFLLRRPLRDPELHPLGTGVWREMHGYRLWVWQFNVAELERQLARRGFFLTHRIIGELSQIHHRLGGPLLKIMPRLNSLGYSLKGPIGPAAQILLVFQKA